MLDEDTLELSNDEKSELELEKIKLKNIAENKNIPFSEIEADIDELASDGQASRKSLYYAYRNLLIRGYTADMAKEILNAIKATAFLTGDSNDTVDEKIEDFSESILTGSSSGIKAIGEGISLSDIYSEYAENIGTDANKLTDEQKLEAEYTYFTSEAESKYLPNYKNALEEYNSYVSSQSSGESYNSSLTENLEWAVDNGLVDVENVSQIRSIKEGLETSGMSASDIYSTMTDLGISNRRLSNGTVINGNIVTNVNEAIPNSIDELITKRIAARL